MRRRLRIGLQQPDSMVVVYLLDIADCAYKQEADKRTSSQVIYSIRYQLHVMEVPKCRCGEIHAKDVIKVSYLESWIQTHHCRLLAKGRNFALRFPTPYGAPILCCWGCGDGWYFNENKYKKVSPEIVMFHIVVKKSIVSDINYNCRVSLVTQSLNPQYRDARTFVRRNTLITFEINLSRVENQLQSGGMSSYVIGHWALITKSVELVISGSSNCKMSHHIITMMEEII